MVTTPTPISHLTFVVPDVTHTQNDQEHRMQPLTFHAAERVQGRNARVFAVLPDRAGCVMILFDPSPRSRSHTAVLQNVTHDAECAQEGLPRKYGTRVMLLGALNIFKHIALTRYPHLREFQLDDEASYPCFPDTPEGDDRIRTFATDLLLQKHTYYERHLRVRPTTSHIKHIVKAVKKRISASIDAPFSEFWKAITDAPVARDFARHPKKLEWLAAHKDAIEREFKHHARKQHSWRKFFRTMHHIHNCLFFACCWWRLCIFFDMTPLMGASWHVRFDDLPILSYKIVQSALGGGGRKNKEGFQKRVNKYLERTLTERVYGRIQR